MDNPELVDLPLDAPIRPRPRGCAIPLTALQVEFWNHFREGKNSLSRRFCASAVRLLGSLDVDLLQTSIGAVIQRHESLRTRIISVDGILRQHIDPAWAYRLEFIDLVELSSPDAEREVRCQGQEFIDQRVDLALGRLFEAKLWKLSDREHILILALDHIVSDATSYGILNREIWDLYNQGTRGQRFSLPPLPVQFADYAVWQQQTRVAWMRTHGAYWRDRLIGAPRTEFPGDPDQIEGGQPTTATVYIPFGNAFSAKLRELARRKGSPLSLVVMAIYIIVISRWCNQKDLVVAVVSHGRHNCPELAYTIGLIAGFLHLRIERANDDTFHDLLVRVRLELAAAFEHQGSDRVPLIVPDCSTNVQFNWQSAQSTKGLVDHYFLPEFAATVNHEPPWAMKPSVQHDKAERPLRLQSFPVRTIVSPQFAPNFYDTGPTGIYMLVKYAQNLFSAAAIERLGHHMRSVAQEVAEQPGIPIKEINYEAADPLVIHKI